VKEKAIPVPRRAWLIENNELGRIDVRWAVFESEKEVRNSQGVEEECGGIPATGNA
jgi:hypothetical protein